MTNTTHYKGHIMQTIETKYLPATNTRGSRIKVYSEWASKTYAYDYGAESAHDVAFEKFLAEQNSILAEEYPDHKGPWWVLVASARSLSHQGNVYIVK